MASRTITSSMRSSMKRKHRSLLKQEDWVPSPSLLIWQVEVLTSSWEEILNSKPREIWRRTAMMMKLSHLLQASYRAMILSFSRLVKNSRNSMRSIRKKDAKSRKK